MSLSLAGLAYQRSVASEPMPDPPEVNRGSLSLKRAVQTAIDWETVTPLWRRSRARRCPTGSSAG